MHTHDRQLTGPLIPQLTRTFLADGGRSFSTAVVADDQEGAARALIAIDGSHVVASAERAMEKVHGAEL